MFNRALTEMTNVYQPSTDGKKTIRELRAAAALSSLSSVRAASAGRHCMRRKFI